jgi:DNA-binding IclR family transcriptional regulator
VQTVNWVGRLSPISCTSSGRALLFDHRAEELEGMFAAGVEPGAGPQAPATAAELIERVAAARERGYAIAVDEFEDGLAGVGAPVRDANGRIIAAINVSGPRYRLHDRLEDAGRHVSQATAYLSRAFAAPPPASASTDRIPVIPPPLQPGSHQQGHQPGAPQPAPSV